jgi:aminoglycoside 2''-phosphotransferase
MSFYEALNPADITVDEIIDDVRKYFPKIQADSIQFFYHGTYNVFEINNNYILRVADRDFRNEKGLNMLKKEAAMLSFLKDKLPLAIPEIIYINESIKIPFSIHEKIPGKSLTFHYEELESEDMKRIGAVIGKFLTILHSEVLLQKYLDHFQIDNEKVSEFLSSYKEKWTNRFNEVKEVAFQHLNQEEQNWLIKIFEEYLNDETNFSFSPKLTHCDFDTSNILMEPKTKEITGIIDFENCKIWDPTCDLLFFDEGEDFMKSLLDNYQYSNDISLKNRMKFFYCRSCCAYLVWGTNHNRPGMIKEGKRYIKKFMKIFP